MTGMRVLHAVRSDGFSGVERFICQLARAQTEAGDQVTVIGGDPAQMRATLDGTAIPHIPARTTLEVARAIRRMRRDIDVLNSHMTAADLGTTLALWGRRSRPAVVSTRHFARPRGTVGPLSYDRVVHAVVDDEISISHAVAAAIGVPSTVVHTGLPTRPSSTARREQVVLVAQRLQPEKSTDVAVAAFAQSGIAADGWSLRIAGIGPEREALVRQCESLGIAESAEFLGFRDDVLDLMDASGILLAPCPVEGLGLTVLEAMRSGLPIVAAAGGGHVELLDGFEQSLFPAGDVGDAAAALRRFADQRALRQSTGALLRARQEERFSLDVQASMTRVSYRHAIEDR